MFFLISHRPRFIAGWSAKCACTEIKRWYAAATGIPGAADMPAEDLHALIGYGETPHTYIGRWFYWRYFKFAVIRNPYKRLVSGFLNKYVVEKSRPNHGWLTFAEFIDALEADPDYRLVDLHHFVPQTGEAFPVAMRRHWRWDAVIDVDNFSTDMAKVNQRLALDVPLGHANRTPRVGATVAEAWKLTIDELADSSPPYAAFYDDALRARVRRYYRQDFEYFESLGHHFSI